MSLRPGAVAVMVLALFPSSLFPALLPPIGVATSDSSFSAGRSMVRGQATVFEGDTVRSVYLATRLMLKDGSRYVLGIGSEGAVYRDHLFLLSGSAELINSGKTSRVVASSVKVSAEKLGSAGAVYVTGNDLVTVLVRNGEVKVSRTGASQTTTLRAGQAACFKPEARGARQLEPDKALLEINRVQANQIASLAELSADANCLEPRTRTLTRSFASLTSALAANQAARSIIQTKVDRGIATPAEMKQVNDLEANLRVLQQDSASLAADLNDVIFQHHPAPSDASTHTVHHHTFPQHHHTFEEPHHCLHRDAHGRCVTPEGVPI